jgi:hypothetical protein
VHFVADSSSFSISRLEKSGLFSRIDHDEGAFSTLPRSRLERLECDSWLSVAVTPRRFVVAQHTI